MPKWINQYIIEAHSNMSTDMAISLAKKFIRQISQPFDHTQTGISLWTLEDIEERQRKDREEAERAIASLPGGQVNGDRVYAGAGGYDGDGLEGFEGPESVLRADAGVREVEMDMEYGEIDDAALMDIPMDEM